jgi:hypothetical protein
MIPKRGPEYLIQNKGLARPPGADSHDLGPATPRIGHAGKGRTSVLRPERPLIGRNPGTRPGGGQLAECSYHAFFRGCHNWPVPDPAARLAQTDQWLGDGATGDQATSSSNASQAPSRPAVVATALR